MIGFYLPNYVVIHLCRKKTDKTNWFWKTKYWSTWI